MLHGHRHAAGELTLGEESERPLRVLNAGSSPALGTVRLIAHRDGRILAQRWIDADAFCPGRATADAVAA